MLLFFRHNLLNLLQPIYKMLPIKILFNRGMLFQRLGAFQAIKYHEQIAVHTVGKQRYQGKQINYQPDVLNVVRHSSIRNSNFLLVDDTAVN